MNFKPEGRGQQSMFVEMLSARILALTLFPGHFGADVTPLKYVSVSVAVEVQAQSRKAIFTIVNNGTVDVTFTPRADFLAAYLIRQGKRVVITWDGSNADMRQLGLFDVVTLAPGAMYRKQTTLDLRRSGEIRKGEMVKAILNPLRYSDFEPGLRSHVLKRKAQLLPRAAASPQTAIR